MTNSKSLPARPSLESLRKQAKKLARDIAAGDVEAAARARGHLPNLELLLTESDTRGITQRNAQLVIAREYGYTGWQELTAEVSRRLGRGFELAAAQARRIIHNNDVKGLKQLLAEHPALLSWTDNNAEGGLLGMGTIAFGDCFDPGREKSFTHAECAEVLIDAGAVVTPRVCEGILQSRARGLLHLFHRKGLLPSSLKFLAALGDNLAVRAALDETGNDLAAVNDAFMTACAFEDEAIASVLLERAITLDAELRSHVYDSGGSLAFIRSLIENRSQFFEGAASGGPWRLFLIQRVMRAVHDDDLNSFVGAMEREPWLLGETCAAFQARIIETATLNDRATCIGALLDLNPAILRRQPPPQSEAIEIAFTYAKAHLIPLLTRIWQVPDDLPHAAGMGNLLRVKEWFDESGAPRLGDLENHYPCNNPRARRHLHWDPPALQQVLDVALAFSVTNSQFEVADFVLEHGADINTNWNSHEPASILHHLVFEGSYESMQFLIDRGIDMTIKDYRWNSTAEGWARYGKQDERMAEWLKDAELKREKAPG